MPELRAKIILYEAYTGKSTYLSRRRPDRYTNALSLHQLEHAPAQVFTRVSGVAHGFRC